MLNLEEYFPALSQFTYLDTPVMGLISKKVYLDKIAHNEYLWNNGSKYYTEYVSLSDEVREKIGAFFNAEPGYVTLVPAFSFGFNAILEGLPHHSKILLLSNDYPAINLAVEARHYKTSYAKIDHRLEENVQREFEKAAPDMFIFSIVQYLNGIKMDLAFIDRLKKAYPDTLFIADGTQYLGMESFDFKKSGIDILGASGYKWLGAGFGNGFFMFKPAVAHRINPKHLGPGSTMGKYKEKGNTLIGKFEGNHLNLSNMGALKTALEFMEEVGITRIQDQIDGLGKKAKALLEEMNVLEDEVVQRIQHSSIFNIRGDEQLYHNLREKGILCAWRGDGIRIGLQYYNSVKDLQKLKEELINNGIQRG